MEPFARTIEAAKQYVVSSTLDKVDWNAELVRGDLGTAVQQLKREPGKGLFVGGVKLPLALAELGLIDEYELVVHPRLAGHGPTLFAGLSKPIDLRLVSRLEFGSGAVAMRYEPRRQPLGLLARFQNELLQWLRCTLCRVPVRGEIDHEHCGIGSGQDAGCGVGTYAVPLARNAG